jgi:predicted PurR-regulated permease PerM
MNTLSWLIYLSDIANNIQMFLVMTATAMMFVYVIWFLSSHMERDVERPPKILLCGLLLYFVAVFIPSTTGIRAIAASEFAAKWAQTDQAQRILNPGLEYVETWLKNKADEEKAKRRDR